MAMWPTDLPTITLQTPSGAQAVVALQGAQVLSWRSADGRERLYLSPKAVWDGSASIRGGVPICWPQFNRRGALAKHGFARMVPWRIHTQSASQVQLVLTQADVPAPWLHNAQGDLLWPYAFTLLLTVALSDSGLRLHLDVHNQSDTVMPFTCALHTYFACDDVAQLQIQGANNTQYWDAASTAKESHPMRQGAITLVGEVDRVYPAFQATLQEPTAQLHITQSATMAETVVWNPGEALAQGLSDIPAGGWRHFVCVEAAQIDQAVQLDAGQHWCAEQVLSVPV